MMEATEKLGRARNHDMFGMKPTDSLTSGFQRTPVRSQRKAAHVSEEQELSETSFKITHASEKKSRSEMSEAESEQITLAEGATHFSGRNKDSSIIEAKEVHLPLQIGNFQEYEEFSQPLDDDLDLQNQRSSDIVARAREQ